MKRVRGSAVLWGIALLISGQTLKMVLVNTSATQKIYIRGVGSPTNKLYLVANASNTTPDVFTTIASNPNNIGIILEDSNVAIKINNLGLSTGTDTIPYIAPDNLNNPTNFESIPLVYNITTAGTGTNPYFLFTTWRTGNNNLPLPSWSSAPVNQVVTHLCKLGPPPSCTGPNYNDNAPYTIDRYWLIHPQGFTNKPAITFEFGYRDVEWQAQSITEANLKAQRWNPTTKTWGDMLPVGTANTAANRVGSVNITSSNLFSFWTLVDATSPLPVVEVNFETYCNDNDYLTIRWESKENNSFVEEYIIETSKDGKKFNAVASVKSSDKDVYVLTLAEITPPIYVRIIAKALDGSTTTSNPKYIEKCEKEPTIGLFSPDNRKVNVKIKNIKSGFYNLHIYDNKGKLIISDNISVSERYFEKTYELQEKVSSSVYKVFLYSDEKIVKSGSFYIQSW